MINELSREKYQGIELKACMGLYLDYMGLCFTNSQFTVRKIFVSGLSLIYAGKSYKGNVGIKSFSPQVEK